MSFKISEGQHFLNISLRFSILLNYLFVAQPYNKFVQFMFISESVMTASSRGFGIVESGAGNTEGSK